MDYEKAESILGTAIEKGHCELLATGFSKDYKLVYTMEASPFQMPQAPASIMTTCWDLETLNLLDKYPPIEEAVDWVISEMTVVFSVFDAWHISHIINDDKFQADGKELLATVDKIDDVWKAACDKLKENMDKAFDELFLRKEKH